MSPMEQNTETLLHRYVDGELSQEETDFVLSELQNDEALKSRICQMQHTKSMLNYAYPLETENQSPKNVFSSKRQLLAVASIFLILISGIAGGLINQKLAQPETTLAATAEPVLDDAIKLQPAIADPRKVVLHIDSADTDKLAQVLDYAEYLLHDYKQNNIKVEVIANAGGINLFRAGVSPYQQRLQELSSHYDNLRLIACSNAIARLQEHGEKAILIPEAHTGETAIDHIIGRLQQGWTYKKI